MKKAATPDGLMALTTICGLAGWQAMVGLNTPLFRYTIDGSIVIVLPEH